MIQTIHLQKIYNKNLVLDLPDFKVETGEVLGIVGNNGAGKTTFFSLILDLIRASNGKIIINDIEVARSEKWKEITGAYIDESFTIGYLTPDEYFDFIGGLRGMNKKDILDFLEGFSDFFNDEISGKKKFIRDLSKGNQKKTGIVGALMGNPSLVILDEPFANLDPSSQYKLRNIIKGMSSNSNKTFLISSHDLDNVTDVCRRIAVLEKGKIVKDVIKTDTTLSELEAFFTGVKQEVEYLDQE